MFAVQRQETNSITRLMAGNLRIKLRRQMEAQAQQIRPFGVVLEKPFRLI